MPQLIYSSSVKVIIPLRVQLGDFFQPDEQLAVEWISSEFQDVSLFSGLLHYTKNTGETFVIRGKPGYCSAVLAELNMHGIIVDKRPQNPSVKFWVHLTGKR